MQARGLGVRCGLVGPAARYAHTVLPDTRLSVINSLAFWSPQRDHRPMNLRLSELAFGLGLAFVPAPLAAATVTVDHRPDGTGFAFQSVPAPARDDAAAKAAFVLVDGAADPNGGPLAVLNDGRIPTEEDQPAANFFFRAGTDGGRLRLDLGSVIAVRQVNTYSWHPGTRAPQVYRLYAADGAAPGFTAAPKRGTDPQTCGWDLLATVNTVPEGTDPGGQYGVSVSDAVEGSLGRFRHLLFDMTPTDTRDAFGHTFYSEIDVWDADAPPPAPVASGDGERIGRSFDAADGKYRFTLDASAAPDLLEWSETKLRPVVQEWYPKLVAMLPSDGFQAATNITLRFRNDMGGTPASAGGGRVNLNSAWFRRELQREAPGSVVHELVHVVQDYGRARRGNPGASRTPGWLVEGIADYIRWFLYEPETKGAEITERNFARAKYDASYRVTGNFLNWVTATHDREIVRKLNAAAREGRYAEALWKEWTGRTLPELGEDWRRACEARINAARGAAGPETPAPDAR